MRGLLFVLCIAMPISAASAQTSSGTSKSDTSTSGAASDTRHSEHSTGKTVLKDNGQMQPQGPTGPITTGSSGGAPASSPQGQTPPNMQAAPEGSSKTIEGPK